MLESLLAFRCFAFGDRGLHGQYQACSEVSTTLVSTTHVPPAKVPPTLFPRRYVPRFTANGGTAGDDRKGCTKGTRDVLTFSMTTGGNTCSGLVDKIWKQHTLLYVISERGEEDIDYSSFVSIEMGAGILSRI